MGTVKAQDPAESSEMAAQKPLIRVGIIDDQQLVRTGFSMVIDSQDDMKVVLEAPDGELALQRLEVVPVDVVLMDVRMPKLDGLEATRRITSTEYSHGAHPKVIVLTTFDLDEYMIGAVTAGASGFLVKDAPPEEMLRAIRTVFSGDAVIAPTSTKRLLAHVAAREAQDQRIDPSVLDGLTERELEVLAHMARGESNTEIAACLDVAEATVKTHVGRIFAKLHVRDRVQAVVLAFASGLVNPGDMSF